MREHHHEHDREQVLATPQRRTALEADVGPVATEAEAAIGTRPAASGAEAPAAVRRRITRAVTPRVTVVVSLPLPASASACARQMGAVAGSGAPQIAAVPDSQSIRFSRRGARPTQQGPTEQFTGTVRIEPLFAATAQSRAAGASVSFEPGRALRDTHIHSGQVLIVTAGTGRVQRRGGPVEEIWPGDVVWIPPGVEHWHGAAPRTTMTHIAIQEQLDGKVVEWGWKVSDDEYR